MGNSGSSIMEGNTNNNTGPPGSLEAVKKANKDIAEILLERKDSLIWEDYLMYFSPAWTSYSVVLDLDRHPVMRR
jgi:hypothetical protein